MSQKPRVSGASQSKHRISDRLDAWVAHHSTSAIESLLRLLRTPLQSLLTWLVVAIAVALPAALFLAIANLQNIGYSWQDSSQISVFLHKNATEEAALALRDDWRNKPEIAGVDYISPAQALEEFQTYSGLGRVVEDVADNPLPAVLLVQPATTDLEELEQLAQSLSEASLVDDVRLDMQWLTRLQQLMTMAQRGVAALALLLALGVLLVIGNTIRLAIENRRDEILVVKLVGGTNAYVRRPLLYTGFWYGLGGGILALLLLGGVLWWMAGPVGRLADLYQSDFRLQGLGWIASAQLALLAGLIGWLGAWLAVARHLSQIQPR